MTTSHDQIARLSCDSWAVAAASGGRSKLLCKWKRAFYGYDRHYYLLSRSWCDCDCEGKAEAYQIMRHHKPHCQLLTIPVHFLLLIANPYSRRLILSLRMTQPGFINNYKETLEHQAYSHYYTPPCTTKPKLAAPKQYFFPFGVVRYLFPEAPLAFIYHHDPGHHVASLLRRTNQGPQASPRS